MPFYEHKCNDCGAKFEIRAQMKDSGNTKPKCPQCGSEKTARVFSFFGAFGGSSSSASSCAPSSKGG